MSWPLSHEFNEAVQSPKVAFADPDLRDGETVVGATGLPLPRSGNFADVYQLRGADGREWAVKCFTRPVTGLAERYAKIAEALEKANLPFTVGFKYLAEGIRVGGAWRPVVKMEWVEGLLLNQVARDAAAKPALLGALGVMWVKLCRRLRDAGLAHADLQHGNVLLVPGAKPGTYGLKLIDYDGVWVPALANTPSGESGHPSYQHPQRAATRAYSPDVDRFPHLAIAAALRGLSVGGAALWEKYDNGDNLLFTEDDYKNPTASKAMRELWQTEYPAVQSLVGRLAIACGKPIPQTPWLDQLTPDGDPAPLDSATRKEAAAALGVPIPVPVALPPAVPAAVAPSVFDLPDDGTDLIDAAPRRAARRAGVPPRGAKGGNALLVVVLGGVVLGGLALAGVAAAVLMSAGKTKPTELTQEDPPPVAPRPDEGGEEPPRPKGPNPPAPKPPEADPPRPGPGAPEPSPEPLPATAVFKERVRAKLDAAANELRFDGDGRAVLAYASNSSALAVVDPRTGNAQTVTAPTTLHPYSLVPLTGGRAGVWVSRPPSVALVDLAAGKVGGTLTLPALPPGGPATPAAVAASPDGRYVAVGLRGVGKTDPQTKKVAYPPVAVRVVDTKAEKNVLETEWESSGPGGGIAFAADGSRVLVVEPQGRGRWFKLPEGEPDGTWALPAGARVSAVSGNARTVLAVAPVSGRPRPVALDAASGRQTPLTGVFETGIWAGIGLSADGRRALLTRVRAAATRERDFAVADTATGAEVARLTLPAEDGPGVAAALAPDGKSVAVGEPRRAGPLVVYDLDAGPAVADGVEPALTADPPALRPRWDAPAGTAKGKTFDQLLFAPDANAVLLGGPNGAEVLDAKGAPRAAGFVGLRTAALADAFPLPDGKFGTVNPKGEVRVWNGKTGVLGGGALPPDPGAGAGAATALRGLTSPNEKFLFVARTGPPAADHPEVPVKVFDAARKELFAAAWAGGAAHFAGDSTRLLLVEWSGRGRWFDLPAGTVAAEWDLGPARPNRPHQVTAASADGAVLGYVGPLAEKGNGSAVLDGATGKPVRVFHRDYHANSPVDMSADGRRAALVREVGRTAVTLDVVDVPSGVRVGRARVTTAAGAGRPLFALSPDGRGLAVFDASRQRLHVFDVPADTPKAP